MKKVTRTDLGGIPASVDHFRFRFRLEDQKQATPHRATLPAGKCPFLELLIRPGERVRLHRSRVHTDASYD